MKLSVVIPAHNEEGNISETVQTLYNHLNKEQINHEILIINDNSVDNTEKLLKSLSRSHESVRYLNNTGQKGYGFAVRYGLENFSGDAVAVYMADASDTPKDLVKYYRTMMKENVDCVFGTRFSAESNIQDYPKLKLFLNRVFNIFLQILFFEKYNDITNGFKLFNKRTINGIKPFLSNHFNLAVELPLKAIVRGYSFAVVSNDWINRTEGESKLNLKEMAPRYLFIVLYCFLEKWLSKGDYRKQQQ